MKMDRRISSPIILLGVMTFGCGIAEATQLPPDPITPTSTLECYELFDRYRAIFSALYGESNVLYKRALSSGDRAVWEPLYAEVNRLHKEADQIRAMGNEARVRCLQQVEAYAAIKRNEADSLRRQALETYGQATGKEVVHNSLKYAKEHSKSPGGSAMAATTLRFWSLKSKIDQLSGRQGVLGYANMAVDVTSRNPLQKFLTKSAFSLLKSVNEEAQERFFGDFKNFSSGAAKIDLYKNVLPINSSSGGAPLTGAVAGLADEWSTSVSAAEEMNLKRVVTVVVKPKESKPSRRQTKARKSGNGGMTPAQCQALIASKSTIYERFVSSDPVNAEFARVNRIIARYCR